MVEGDDFEVVVDEEDIVVVVVRNDRDADATPLDAVAVVMPRARVSDEGDKVVLMVLKSVKELPGLLILSIPLPTSILAVAVIGIVLGPLALKSASEFETTAAFRPRTDFAANRFLFRSLADDAAAEGEDFLVDLD
jgi:hypothetical protein